MHVFKLICFFFFYSILYAYKEHSRFINSVYWLGVSLFQCQTDPYCCFTPQCFDSGYFWLRKSDTFSVDQPAFGGPKSAVHKVPYWGLLTFYVYVFVSSICSISFLSNKMFSSSSSSSSSLLT